ncbi:MAG: hypothetical protein U1E48_04265 [Paracoccaceae bacterium]
MTSVASIWPQFDAIGVHHPEAEQMEQDRTDNDQDKNTRDNHILPSLGQT